MAAVVLLIFSATCPTILPNMFRIAFAWARSVSRIERNLVTILWIRVKIYLIGFINTLKKFFPVVHNHDLKLSTVLFVNPRESPSRRKAPAIGISMGFLRCSVQLSLTCLCTRVTMILRIMEIYTPIKISNFRILHLWSRIVILHSSKILKPHRPHRVKYDNRAYFKCEVTNPMRF